MYVPGNQYAFVFPENSPAGQGANFKAHMVSSLTIGTLLHGSVSQLKERGIKESNIVIESVPGSYELPLA
jgi:6,7-dimethyl-8-ribityllumazine synthase